MKIIQKRKIFFALSAVLVVTSVVFLSIWGLNLGIDFKGGTLLEVKFADNLPSGDEIKQPLEEFDLGSLTVQASEDRTALVRFSSDDDSVNDKVLNKIKDSFEGSSIERVEFISSTISDELRSKAMTAIVIAVVAIAAYIAWAFRGVSRPVESWKYGVAAVIALAHDTLITVGVFSYLGQFHGVEVNIPFVAALLTILGYSVNDTIVVFDRVRENLSKAGAKKDFENTINNSIIETLSRSINTSLTVAFVLLAIIFLGGVTIKFFSVAMLIGIIFGTYSSIFVASALLVEVWKYKQKNT
ncbi:MAG: protein translocase subunit SecF [Patescibacteria group bacterium]|nr:protein translocase subunit SecF [Patescibacteria group bacterium]